MANKTTPRTLALIPKRHRKLSKKNIHKFQQIFQQKTSDACRCVKYVYKGECVKRKKKKTTSYCRFECLRNDAAYLLSKCVECTALVFVGQRETF